MIIVNRALWTLVPALVLSGFGPAQAAGTSYQWVDATGRVMYGDSPPSVTYTRRVGDYSSPDLLRDLPPSALGFTAAPATPSIVATPDIPTTSEENAGSSDQIDEVLAKLNAALAQVEALTADKLETTVTPAAEPSRETPVVESVPGSDLAAAAQSLIASTTTAPAPQLNYEPNAAPVPATAAMVKSPVAAKPRSKSGVSVAVAQPVEVVLDGAENDTSEVVAEAAAEAVHVPAVLGTVPPMEVAVSRPQPIESRMSPKDRARARWRRENVGEMRFLKRLAEPQATPASLEAN
jgi:hypothetical protein